MIIHHPLSPYKGQRYSRIVELIDIFPTINDLTQAKQYPKNHCHDMPSSHKVDNKQGNNNYQNTICIPLFFTSLFSTKRYCYDYGSSKRKPDSSNIMIVPPDFVCRKLQGKSLVEVRKVF